MNEEMRLRKLKTVQNLDTVAFIAGPVSIIVGGVLLGLIALICAIISFVKVRGVCEESPQDDLAASLRRQSVIAIAVAGVAFCIDCAFFTMTVLPLMQALSTGDQSQILEALSGTGDASGAGSSSDGTSVWDQV